MNWTPQNVDDILNKPEGENLEFKEARNRYDFEKLTQYCVALANEGGGKIILGVTDSRPRQVVGSNAFRQPERTRAGLNQRLHLGITFDEVFHPNGRVLVFHVPSRPGGIAIQYDGRYLVRDNDSLVGMPGERLSEIVAEAGHDFSADSCPDLTMDDLETQAIEHFRQRWINKRGDSGLPALSREQLLADIEAVTDDGVTYAALVLFGSHAAMRKHLAQAEVVFEYRSSNAAGPAQQREEFTEAFFLWYDRLWELVNLRNDQQHYQDGMFVLDVPMFGERAVREAILNAVSHRNYQLGGNIFVRQYPDRIEIDSPGGFPREISPENILYRQSPRNRRIAEIFAKCGLVERAGQGVDLMYRDAIRQSKPHPDFTKSDQYTVSLSLAGRIRNAAFVRFLNQFESDDIDRLGTDEWLVLDSLSREEPVSDDLRPCTNRLIELGMVVRAGRDQHILSETYYRFQNRIETYNRLREREKLKEIIESRIQDHAVDGCPLRELLILPADLTRDKVRGLLDELRAEGRIHSQGVKRGARWFPGPEATDG
jgi:ATP-dependent DNA helicase RecG